MLIDDLETIFIHIPKTAGVSISHALLSHILKKETDGPLGSIGTELKTKFNLSSVQQRHWMAKDFISSYNYNKWKKYYKFAIIRNPWDRAISEWKWSKRSFRIDEPLMSFIKRHEKLQNMTYEKTSNKKMWIHTQPQYLFITNKNNKIIIDDVFRFENLEEAVKQINKNLNINLQLKQYNTTKRSHYRKYYDNETKKLIHNLFKKDIEMFDYEF